MKKMTLLIAAIPIVWPFLFVTPGWALDAGELLIVANRDALESAGIARYYMEARGVPDENLLWIATTDVETCGKEEYDRRIAEPIRARLKTYPLAKRPRCIVLIKGVPLRIGPVPLTQAAQAEIEGMRNQQKVLNDRLLTMPEDEAKKQLLSDLKDIDAKIEAFNFEHNTGASVDSELMLVLAADYALSMWVANPFFVGFKDRKPAVSKNDVIMVSRLDAPTEEIVRRMIDDAVAAEEKGLTGKAYFDARWPDPADKPVSGYALYDKSIHQAAERLREDGRMPVVLDQEGGLFQPGACPDAALYCGWYSLARYVDAFEWVPGAVGYHIASAECQTLRSGSSQVWCKRMLEDGVAVTIGPVDEPYVEAFPFPEVFFSALVKGGYSVAEAYLLSAPCLSWKMVLVGDPLYRPFKIQETGDRNRCGLWAIGYGR